jgi:RNA-directed DNA polymerase
VERCQAVGTEGRRARGCAWQPSKTRRTQTLDVAEGTPGVDLLGFPIRPYPVGKTKAGKACQGRLHGCTTRITPSPTAMQRHVEALRKTLARQRHAEQEALMNALNPQSIGGRAYEAHVGSARVLQRLDHTVYTMRWGGAVSRHPKKATHGMARQSWRVDDGQGWRFQPANRTKPLARHAHTPHQRYGKVQGTRSP